MQSLSLSRSEPRYGVLNSLSPLAAGKRASIKEGHAMQRCRSLMQHTYCLSSPSLLQLCKTDLRRRDRAVQSGLWDMFRACCDLTQSILKTQLKCITWEMALKVSCGFFNFMMCYFFIKARWGSKILLSPKKRKKHKEGGRGRPCQQARLLKMVWNRLCNWDSIYLPSR